MDRARAEHLILGAKRAKLIAEHVIDSEWSFVAENYNIGDLENPAERLEALFTLTLYGLMALARERRLNFDLRLREAMEIASGVEVAQEVLTPLQ